MKRLLSILHCILVSLTIVLMTVQPAAACRLLRARCCCVCCDPCGPASCTVEPRQLPPGEAIPPAERSPSDAPPGATSDAGGHGSPVTSAAPTDVTLPQAAPPAVKVPSASETPVLTLGEPLTTANGTAPSRSQTIVEPTVAPAPSAATRRMPARAAAPVESAVATPSTDVTAPETRSGNQAPQPMPQSLRPLQGTGASAGSLPPVAAPGTASHAAAGAPPVTVKRSAESPMPQTALPAPAGSRTVAQPGGTGSLAPVTSPAFPKADDDPFAPAAPAAPIAPATSPLPAADDPFAPLPPAGAPTPSAPLAAEPTTLRVADALVPGTDGRLPVREWRDDSGKFQIKARLILILDGKVRLLKETGRTTTVPVARLSSADQAYVNEIISRYGKDLTGLDKLAAR